MFSGSTRGEQPPAASTYRIEKVQRRVQGKRGAGLDHEIQLLFEPGVRDMVAGDKRLVFHRKLSATSA